MEGSITFLSFIICIGLFLGTTISLFLFLKKSSRNKSNIYLGILVVCSSLYLIAPFIYFIGSMEDLPHVYRLGRLAAFVTGPMVYLYVRSCTQKNFKMHPILWIHFIPAILDKILHIPIYTLSPELKIEYFQLFMQTGIFKGQIEAPLAILLSVIHGGVYSVFSVKIVLKYRKHLTETSSFIDNSFHHWLLVFCGVLAFPIIITLIWGVSIGVPFDLNVLYFGFVFLNIAVFVATLLKPELFHAFPHQMPIFSSTEENVQKYENSNLKEEQKKKYLERLQSSMQAEKYFKEPELTIQQLSEQVNIPANYLSQIINEKLNCNFLDFVNQHRVEATKKLLVNSDFNHYSIVAIGYEGGFNSKSTFYAAFKKFTNTTPGEFRKSMIIS